MKRLLEIAIVALIIGFIVTPPAHAASIKPFVGESCNNPYFMGRTNGHATGTFHVNSNITLYWYVSQGAWFLANGSQVNCRNFVTTITVIQKPTGAFPGQATATILDYNQQPTSARTGVYCDQCGSAYSGVSPASGELPELHVSCSGNGLGTIIYVKVDYIPHSGNDFHAMTTQLCFDSED